jgi:hypothetical protein
MGKDSDCLGCGQKFKQKDACVQCNICGLWSHKTCSGLTTEYFNAMVEQSKAAGMSFWACRPCRNYAAGMNHRLKEVQDMAKEAITIAKDNVKEMDVLKAKVDKQEEKVEKRMNQVEIDIYDEMSLREEKRKNVVIHGLSEPTGEDGWTRMEEDKKQLNKIFTLLDINVVVETDVEFCRRVGEKSERARPLVVGFYTEWAKSTLIKNSRYLADSDMDHVSVAPDLTEKQRRAERDLQLEAEKRNAEISEEDAAKNLVWKVVGKRGQKRLIKVYDREQGRGGGRGGGAAGGGRGRGLGRGGAGAGAIPRGGVNLLPARGARGVWRPNVGRGAAEQRGGAAARGRAAEPREKAAEKRRRSGEEEQGRKRGRPPAKTRATTMSQQQQMSSGEEEETEMESSQHGLSSQPTPSSQMHSVGEEEGAGGGREEVEMVGEGEGGRGGIRLGEE